MGVQKLATFIVTVFMLGYASAVNLGSINIEGVGPIYIVGGEWTAEFVNVTTDGSGFTLSRGGRIYFAKDPAEDFSDPFMYWQAPLKGYHFSYEIGNYQDNLKLRIETN